MRRQSVVFLAAVALPALAHAQGAGTSAAPTAPVSDGHVSDIVVTSERRENNLQRVPIAVSAITAKSLQDHQISETSDLEKEVPGLRITPNITQPTNITIALRGSIQQDASLVVAESPVGLYADDVYVARLNGANAQFDDIERIEVLRGPQGTLYGRNTLEGAVRIISKTPGPNNKWTTGSVGYGSYGNYKVSASEGHALVGDSLFGSISVLANGLDGYYHNIATNKQFGRQRNYATRGKLRYLAGKWDVTGSVAYYNDKNQGTPMPAGLSPAGRYTSAQVTSPYGSLYNVSIPTVSQPGIISASPTGRTAQLVGSLTAAYALTDDITLKSITGYVRTRDYFTNEISGSGAQYLASEAQANQYSQEFQALGSSFDDRLKWIAGAYLFRESANQRLDLLTTQASKIRTDSVSFFGQATYNLTQSLSATGGIRWTHDDKKFEGEMRSLELVIPAFDFNSHNKYSAWTPKFSINYQMPSGLVPGVDSALLYVSAARGFKSGGYNGLPIVSAGVFATVYAPETNWTYEGGVKITALDRKVRLNAAYFYNMISNLTANATVAFQGTNVFPVTNVGNATIQGLELEAAASPVSGLNLFANATFQQGHYRNLNPTSTPVSAAALYGQIYVPQLPTYSFTTGFDYTTRLPVWRDLKFKFGGDWFRTGAYALTVNNDFIINPYSRLAAFAALDKGPWELRFSVKNLANKTQIVSGTSSFGGYIPLPPREFMGTLSVKL